MDREVGSKPKLTQLSLDVEKASRFQNGTNDLIHTPSSPGTYKLSECLITSQASGTSDASQRMDNSGAAKHCKRYTLVPQNSVVEDTQQNMQGAPQLQHLSPTSEVVSPQLGLDPRITRDAVTQSPRDNTPVLANRDKAPTGHIQGHDLQSRDSTCFNCEQNKARDNEDDRRGHQTTSCGHHNGTCDRHKASCGRQNNAYGHGRKSVLNGKRNPGITNSEIAICIPHQQNVLSSPDNDPEKDCFTARQRRWIVLLIVCALIVLLSLSAATVTFLHYSSKGGATSQCAPCSMLTADSASKMDKDGDLCCASTPEQLRVFRIYDTAPTTPASELLVQTASYSQPKVDPARIYIPNDTNVYIATFQLSTATSNEVRQPDRIDIADVDERVTEVALTTWQTSHDTAVRGSGFEYLPPGSRHISSIKITREGIYEIHLSALVKGYRDDTMPENILFSQKVMLSNPVHMSGHKKILGDSKIMACPHWIHSASGCDKSEAQRIVHLRENDEISVTVSHPHLLIPADTTFSIHRL